MKRFSILATLLSLLLVFSLFAGCAQEAGPSASPEQSQTSVTPSAEVSQAPQSIYPMGDGYELEYWFPLGSTVLTFIKGYEENPTMQEAEKQTGVKINWVSPMTDNAAELFNLIIASNDLPDMMIQNSTIKYVNGYDAAINDGYFLPLNDYMDEFAPNYKKVLAANDVYQKAAMTDGGNYAGFPLFYSTEKNCIGGVGYRRDILESLGYNKIPETISDWEEVFKLLLDNDYKNFLNLQEYGADQSFNLWVGAYDLTCTFMQKDGKVSYGPLEAGFKDYLMQMNDWYARGIMDQNISVTFQNYYSNWATGVTIVGGTGDGSVGPAFFKNGMSENPDFFLAAAPYPKKDENQTVHIRSRFSYLTQQTCISQSCEIPEVAMRWCDFWYSDESTLLKNYGIEGVTYNKDGDKKVFTEMVNNSKMRLLDGLECYTFLNGLGIQLTGPQYDADPYKKSESSVWQQTQYDWCMPIDLTMSADENTEYSSIMSDINTLLQENVSAFIMGTKTFDEFDGFIKQIKSMNIDRAVEIQQAALVRFNAR